MRAEDRGERRVLAFVVLLGNVVISMRFVFYPVICRSCGYDDGGGEPKTVVPRLNFSC